MTFFSNATGTVGSWMIGIKSFPNFKIRQVTYFDLWMMIILRTPSRISQGGLYDVKKKAAKYTIPVVSVDKSYHTIYFLMMEL